MSALAGYDRWLGRGNPHDPDEQQEHGRGCRCPDCDPDHHRDGGLS